MVSPNSRLYEKRPDWCLHVPGRERKTARWQLVLDMTRPEVRDYLFEAIGKVLEEGQGRLREMGHEPLPHRCGAPRPSARPAGGAVPPLLPGGVS